MASDRKETREYKVRRHLDADPAVSLLLAAVNFEWTVCRAVLFLSKTPNSKLRALMRDYYSLERYKQLWKKEIVATRVCNPFPLSFVTGRPFVRRLKQEIRS